MRIISKRATKSSSKNPLENFDKLGAYAYRSSFLAKKQAKANGIVYTIIKNGRIYKIFPDGRKTEIKLNKSNVQVLFEPISTVN